MKVTTTATILAAALGVSAHPSGHAHKRAHRSLEQRNDFVMASRPEPTLAPPPPPPAPEPTVQALPPPPAPEPEPEVNVETTDDGGDDVSASGGGGMGVSSFTDFCGGAARKRATLDQIAYQGNIGAPGNYGCNLMLAQTKAAESYKYVVNFENASDEEQECVCFLKIGPTGGINGFFDGNEALRFNLPANGVQSVVGDDNSQGGCSCSPNTIDTTSFGEFAGTWLEFDFGNESNGGWSGADASCLVAAAEGLDIPGLKVCGSGTCSTINPGGTGDNAYLGGMEALDGVGLNLPAGKVRLDVTVAYQG